MYNITKYIIKQDSYMYIDVTRKFNFLIRKNFISQTMKTAFICNEKKKRRKFDKAILKYYFCLNVSK